MAFTLKNFGSEVANAKSILGGVCYYRYFNADGDTITTAGYFPSNLGLKEGDRICVIPDDLSNADVWYYVSDVTDGVVTVAALS
ncbi:MAG: hypothetical protein II219_02570 [Alphaproteobacteria bacterium]|nr:hypothetical protein [Alphaproteobacteria bacterium]